jgi:hypothetical protein
MVGVTALTLTFVPVGQISEEEVNGYIGVPAVSGAKWLGKASAYVGAERLAWVNR